MGWHWWGGTVEWHSGRGHSVRWHSLGWYRLGGTQWVTLDGVALVEWHHQHRAEPIPEMVT